MKEKLYSSFLVTNSVQLKFAAAFLVLIAALFIILNTYPTIVSRDLVFASKKASLASQAGVMSSALSTLDELSVDTVREVINLLDLRSLTRVIVTCVDARILYDTALFDPSTGRYALFSEISRALLNNQVVYFSVYDGRAFMTSKAMPIVRDGVIVGAVYLYEYDSQQADLITAIQSDLRNVTFVLGAAAIALTLLFSRALTLRITELVKATRTVSEGDYGHQIKIRGRDELSALGEEFNNLTQRLKDTEELRRRFVSDASHELKTPLASIRLLSDSIVNSENMDIATMREFVMDIGDEAERLQRTTEELLSLTRMDGQTDIQRKKFDMRQIVEETLHFLAPLARENRIEIETDLDSACFISGSEDLIYRVIFNLVENAIKYNVPDGTIKIILRQNSSSIILIVEDSGIGIPDEDVPHIFSRFYRVDKARSRDAGGSGLGLSIVHDAVRLHKGTVAVEKREETGGTRFTVTFPIAEVSA